MLTKKDYKPLVSVVIATHNSEKTIELVLKSIKTQNYPNSKIEILIIDGKSTDSTLEIAAKYNSRIFINTKVDQVYAKHIGYRKAAGRYILFLDSDEVLYSKNSIKDKVSALIKNPNAPVAISSGYRVARGYPSINLYLSDLGDPFTYFMYRDSKDSSFFIKNLISKYKKINEDEHSIVLNFSKSKNPPFIELTSMGALIDLYYVREHLPRVFKDYAIHTHLYYLLNSQNRDFVIMKNDIITHYSASSLKKYLNKIKSRIKNNIFVTDMGKAGFDGRELYQPTKYLIKKFMFIPYVLLVLPSLVDSIVLALRRQNTIYLIHFFLSWYALFTIFYFYILKILNIKTNLVGYGV